MTPPWATAGALAVGLLVAFGTFVYTRYREHRNSESHHYRRQSSPSYQGRNNLTCPLCGRRVSANSYVMPCGHKFHRGCYADRLLANRDTHGNNNVICPICGEANERSENESTAAEGLSDRRGTCSYCLTTLRPAGRIQIDCGHFVHPICRKRYFMNQCRICSENRVESGKCSVCEMPIQSSAPGVERLVCGHLAHSQCFAIARFIQCTNCPRAEGEL